MKLPHVQCKVTPSDVGRHKIRPPAVTVCHSTPPLFLPFISLPPSLPLDISISLALSAALPLCHIAYSVLEKIL